MQLRQWPLYWKGYVVILVEGKAPEKFINLCMVKGIQLWDIVPLGKERFLAKVAVSQVKPLRAVARATKARFRIRQKAGVPFAMRKLRRYKAFLSGAVLFIALLYWLSSMIWFIDYSSPEELQELDPQAVLDAAYELGLKPGVFKHSLDTKEIEKALQVRIPRLAWAGIEIQGTRAVIRIVEKKLPSSEMLDERRPGHLVAVKEGVISELLVIDGRPMVQVGDTVTAGQVLISGIVTPDYAADPQGTGGGRPRLVRARGMVRARVWYEGRAEVPLVETGERYTGKEATTVKLAVLDREIILKGPAGPPFTHYHRKEMSHQLVPWRNWQGPVELITTTYLEVEPFRREIGAAEARALALAQALEEVESQLPANCRPVDRSEQVEEGTGGSVRVKVVVEAIEEIAQFQPLT
ncbi:MAG TPA: sporulation protein YqfD [Clostridia bacterium]|nr:sporulation protein YqfD [Clostridia bacterium]